MNRRELLISTAACAGMAAMPAIPVAADPLVHGIRWWGVGCYGVVTQTADDRMPLSYFTDKYCAWYKDDTTHWEVIP